MSEILVIGPGEKWLVRYYGARIIDAKHTNADKKLRGFTAQ